MTRVDDCVLCKIADGKLPSRKMYEEESFLGVLDVNPCIEGHCLVVPKEHVIQFYEMDDDALVWNSSRQPQTITRPRKNA